MKFQRALFVTATGILHVWADSSTDAPSVAKSSLNAQCTISSLDFGPPLAKTGIKIDATAMDCGPGHHDARKCAVDILSVVEMCSWLATYMVANIQSCIGIAEQQANCANSITALVTTIISAATQSTIIAGKCPAAGENKPVKEEKKAVKYGNCVIDVWQSAWFLARVGILINSAVIECDHDQNGGEVERCAARIEGVVASFIAVAHFITGAVNDCGPDYSYGLACASIVLKLVWVLDGVVAAARGIDKWCVQMAPTRRLSNSTVESSIHSLDAVEVAVLAKMNLTEKDMYADPKRVIAALQQQQMKVHNVTTPVVV